MKKQIALLLLLALILFSGCNVKAGWQTFESEQGRFSVLFPGEPEEGAESAPTLEGDVEARYFVAEQGRIGYSVFFIDYPPEVASVDSDALLDEAIRTHMESVKATARRKKEITLDGYPGREFRFETLEEGTIIITRVRYYLVENRMYVLGVLSTAPDASLPDIDKFMDSFQLRP